MKKIVVPVFIFLQYTAFAQLPNKMHRVETVNVKYISKDETLNISKNIVDLSTEQAQKIYLTNLQINRRILGNKNYPVAPDLTSKDYTKYNKEKEIAYRKIMNNNQFQKYLLITKRTEASTVNTNVIQTTDSDGVVGHIVSPTQ